MKHTSNIFVILLFLALMGHYGATAVARPKQRKLIKPCRRIFL